MKKLFKLFILAMLAVCGVACEPTNDDGNGGSTNTFDIKVSNITSDGATVSVTPSNSDTYYFDVYEKSLYDQYASDSDFLAFWKADIQSNIDELNKQGYNITIANYVSSGNDSFTYEGNYALKPNTAYYAFAFGLSTEGEITTDVTKIAFRTLAASGGDEGGNINIDYLVWGRFTGYGDEYNVGARNWVFVLYDDSRTCSLTIELQTEVSATEPTLGEYPISSTLAAGTAIAGNLDEEGYYYGTYWSTSSGSVFCKSGKLILDKSGDNYIITLDAIDQNGNTITASYNGELENRTSNN